MPGAKPVEESFSTRYMVDGSTVKGVLTPKVDGELTEVEYGAVARAEKASADFDDDPFEPMKPERTQFWESMKPERTQIWINDVFKVGRVLGSDWARVSHRDALVAEYESDSHAETVAGAAKVLTMVSGEPCRLVAIIGVGTLSLRLTSTRSQQLTEIEYALADEIEDQLTAEAEE